MNEVRFIWVFPEHCRSLMVESMTGFGSNKMAKVLCARLFEEKEVELIDIFEKVKFLASLWASTSKAFKEFPLSIIILNWKDVIGR